MKKLFIVTVLLTYSAFAQPDFNSSREIIQSGKYYNSEIHFFPAGSSFNVFYIYKISYSQLFFEKISDQFKAGISVNIEIKDSAGHVIDRGFDKQNVSVKDFDQSNSENLFINGLIKFNLPKGKYSFFPFISDLISKRERKLLPITVNISDSTLILRPIVINPEKNHCSDGFEFYQIINNSSAVPFNQPLSSLIIPVTQNNITSLKYSIISAESTIVKDQTIDEIIFLNNAISICDKNAALYKSAEHDSIKYFIIRNFPSRLQEAPVKIEVTIDSLNNYKQNFDIDVIWIHKPRSLLDPEQAIKFLEIVESKEIVAELLSKKDYAKTLNQYWKTKDPTPETDYNELMNEFYSRIDYCEMKFKPIGGNSGAKTDRGKVFIKYGAPDNIERSSNIDDKVVETWFYKQLKRSFIFIDNDGTGKFQLVGNQ
ncbi:MAG: GWxTD domain-containing protein [Ignavibacteriaceae bacterium]|jgi:GWxTD domain-containing protein|nr:GWxTD domain-containing protein [Ignavibacteriaceae bacterium]